MEDSSAVLLLERLVNEGVASGSTDIHLLQRPDGLWVSFRRGGLMTEGTLYPADGGAVVRRIKALARLDVAETRVPQDGSFGVTECFIRVSVLPILSGEAVVLRLLPKQSRPSTLEALGMSTQQCFRLRLAMAHPSGLILVAGPTGCGKTTTLYSMMAEISSSGKCVASIEDPVEMPLVDCPQVQVREHLGVTFHTGIRALLRQDPDVIMVGEIRDADTAHVAARAATSGHLVLSTTHAGDLVGAVVRLVEFGLSRSLIGEVLRAVVVQAMARQAPHSGEDTLSACAGSGSVDVLKSPVSFAVHSVDREIAALLSSDRSWVDVRRRLSRTALARPVG